MKNEEGKGRFGKEIFSGKKEKLFHSHEKVDYFSFDRPKQYLKGLKGRFQNNLSGFLRVLLTAALVAIQIVLLLLLPLLLQSVTVYFYFILELCSVIAIVTLINRNQSPSFRLAWISIVLLLPISGFLMYYMWGRSGKKRRLLDEQVMEQIAYGQKFLVQDEKLLLAYLKKKPLPGRMVKYMVSSGFPLYGENAVEFYSMGEDAFESIFAELEKAKKFVLIDFFIVAEGAIWDKLHEVLKRKIDSGVEVKFIYDDFGAAIRTPKDFKEQLEEEGFEVLVFNPIHKYTGELYMNFRSHQKILVIDGVIGFTGGFNIADEYANLIERFGVWKDSGVCVKGQAVWGLTVIFLQMWEAITAHMHNGVLEKHIDYLKYQGDFSLQPELNWAENTFCQVISDGPANNPVNPIESIYNQMIMYADEFLYITTPYLIIEDYMKQSLVEAVKRGVDVRIITPYIPDKKQVKLLTNYNYGELLRGGVRIYEYLPGFIHAKQMLSENAAIVGTINMDYRSFYLHYENGIWMSGREIQAKIKVDFNNTFAESREITYEEWLDRPRSQKMVQPILNLFSTLF